jgi:hypothetical protein
MKYFLSLAFGIIIVVLASCKGRKSIDNQPRTDLTFQQLPDTLQKLYIYLETAIDSTLIEKDRYIISYGSHQDTLVCLDKEIKKAIYFKEYSWWYHEHISDYGFIFDNKTLLLDNKDSLWEHAPFILYKKQFYVLRSINLISVDDVKSAKYAKYDLSSILSQQ